jgi:hypothetical protein
LPYAERLQGISKELGRKLRPLVGDKMSGLVLRGDLLDQGGARMYLSCSAILAAVPSVGRRAS